MAAVIQRVEGAPELVRHLVLALRQRGWDGDDDLASQLDAMLGTGPAPVLRPLPVDLDELAGILEGDTLHGGGLIDLKTGEVWPASPERVNACSWRSSLPRAAYRAPSRKSRLA